MRAFAPYRLGVGNVNEFDGVVRFDMQVDAATFQDIAEEEGWSLPDRVELNFTPPPNTNAVDSALESLVRIMPRHDRVPAAILSAQLSGRVILRDGCFRLVRQDQADQEPLVMFDRDIELVRDEEGYMALQTPRASEPVARIGELMVWGGPRGVDEGDAGVQALRAACGEGEIVSVGTPSGAYYWRARPWKINQFTESHGVTRQEAWDALRRCWALADEAGSNWPRNIRSVSQQCGVPPQYL